MAGAVDSPSRLGLTLQGFHQVIALSQANVNESLEYHFANNEKLCNFDVVFATKGYGLRGKMSSPTIALIDIEAADQAIFSLNFESGKYFWVEFPELDPGAEPLLDEDGLPILPIPKKESLSVAGWSLAFLVHFSVEKMATVPSGIRSMVELPGSYSVDQLMIDFGTADLIKFSWKHCVIPGVPEEKLATGRADIERFVGAYLNDVLLKPGNHNILGYAVKIDPPSHGQTGQDQLQKVAPVGRYFPPTSVRLQTINHRPDGNATSSSASNDHNAMLFTEMTQFHTMLTKDLQWSGNWFYDGIGGTMAISRGIFVDQYLAEELRVVGVQNWNLANVVSRKLSDNPQHGDWVLKMGQPDMGNIVLTAGHGLEIYHQSFDTNSVKWTSPAKWLVGERLVPSMDHAWENEVVVSFRVIPNVGKGKISIESNIEVTTNRVSTMPGAKILFQIRASVNWTAALNLQAIENGGKLLVSAQVNEPTVQVLITKRDYEIQENYYWLKDILYDQLEKTLEAGTESVKKKTDDVVRNFTALDKIKISMENSLNRQGRFIFPGGGTFEMKDPIFSYAGDLLIGLTYKKGDLK